MGTSVTFGPGPFIETNEYVGSNGKTYVFKNGCFVCPAPIDLNTQDGWAEPAISNGSQIDHITGAAIPAGNEVVNFYDADGVYINSKDCEDADTFATLIDSPINGVDDAGNNYSIGDQLLITADGDVLCQEKTNDTFAGLIVAGGSGTDAAGNNYSAGDTLIELPSGQLICAEKFPDTYATLITAPSSGTDDAGNDYSAGDQLIQLSSGEIICAEKFPDTDTFAELIIAGQAGTDDAGNDYNVGDTLVQLANGDIVCVEKTVDTFGTLTPDPATGGSSSIYEGVDNAGNSVLCPVSHIVPRQKDGTDFAKGARPRIVDLDQVDAAVRPITVTDQIVAFLPDGTCIFVTVPAIEPEERLCNVRIEIENGQNCIKYDVCDTDDNVLRVLDGPCFNDFTFTRKDGSSFLSGDTVPITLLSDFVNGDLVAGDRMLVQNDAGDCKSVPAPIALDCNGDPIDTTDEDNHFHTAKQGSLYVPFGRGASGTNANVFRQDCLPPEPECKDHPINTHSRGIEWIWDVAQQRWRAVDTTSCLDWHHEGGGGPNFEDADLQALFDANGTGFENLINEQEICIRNEDCMQRVVYAGSFRSNPTSELASTVNINLNTESSVHAIGAAPTYIPTVLWGGAPGMTLGLDSCILQATDCPNVIKNHPFNMQQHIPEFFLLNPGEELCIRTQLSFTFNQDYVSNADNRLTGGSNQLTFYSQRNAKLICDSANYGGFQF